MTDKEIEDVMRPIRSVCNTLDYGEAVVIGSAVGQLVSEIKRLRGQKDIEEPKQTE